MAIAGFKLRINGGGKVNEIVDVGYLFEHTFTEGLLPSTEYAVEVASYNDGDPLYQESEWSDPEYITTPTLTLLVDDDGNAILDDDGNAIYIYV